MNKHLEQTVLLAHGLIEAEAKPPFLRSIGTYGWNIIIEAVVGQLQTFKGTTKSPLLDQSIDRLSHQLIATKG